MSKVSLHTGIFKKGFDSNMSEGILHQTFVFKSVSSGMGYGDVTHFVLLQLFDKF